MSIDKIRNIAEDPARPITALFYGDTKVGKTHIVGTYPGPIFIIGVGFERGSDPTLRAMGRKDLHGINIAAYEGHPSGRNDLSAEELVNELPDLIAKVAAKTVAVDTVSLYLQLCKSHYTKYGTENMSYTKWDMIAEHIKNLRDVLHNLNVHVIWTAHVRQDKSDETLITLKPDIVGSSLGNIEKSCNIIAYLDKIVKAHEVEDAKTGKAKRTQKTHYRMWLRCPEHTEVPFKVGTHFDAEFPAEVNAYVPSFRTFEKYLVTGRETPLIAT